MDLVKIHEGYFINRHADPSRGTEHRVTGEDADRLLAVLAALARPWCVQHASRRAVARRVRSADSTGSAPPRQEARREGPTEG